MALIGLMLVIVPPLLKTWFKEKKFKLTLPELYVPAKKLIKPVDFRLKLMEPLGT